MQREEKYEQIDKMAERYLADRSDREAIVFLHDAALESDDYRRRIRHIIEIDFSSAVASSADGYDKEQAYHRFCDRASSKGNTGGTSFFRLHWRSAVAAAAIALAVALPWAGYEYATSSMTRQLAQIRVSSSDGSISEVRLPDGSRVWLNARSHIEYSQGFGISDRNVKLTGEACFDVSKNKELPFVVSTKSANLKVLGTRFTFRDYPEDQCVTVKLMRGHVDIASTKTGKHMEMVGNERLTLNKGTGQMTKMKMEDGNRSDSWIHGELFFDEIPLIQIAQTLERTYKVKIKVAQQLRQRAFYGTFRQTTTIEDILSTMAKTQQMRYKRLKSGEYYIY